MLRFGGLSELMLCFASVTVFGSVLSFDMDDDSTTVVVNGHQAFFLLYSGIKYIYYARYLLMNRIYVVGQDPFYLFRSAAVRRPS